MRLTLEVSIQSKKLLFTLQSNGNLKDILQSELLNSIILYLFVMIPFAQK